MEAANKKSEDQRVKKPAQQQIQKKGQVQAPAGFETSPLAGQALGKLPEGPGTRGLRQAAVLQMQRTKGNAFVMRQMAQRQHEDGTHEEAPAEEGAEPTRISDGASSVETDGGNVSIEGGMLNISSGMVNVDAAMISTSGVLRASTIMADNVVASSYTPGAGNLM